VCISQKTPFFVVTAVKTSNLTNYSSVPHMSSRPVVYLIKREDNLLILLLITEYVLSMIKGNVRIVM
jgi:hypothetical protein